MRIRNISIKIRLSDTFLCLLEYLLAMIVIMIAMIVVLIANGNFKDNFYGLKHILGYNLITQAVFSLS